jgi:type 1 glutamine amidotransferase
MLQSAQTSTYYAPGSGEIGALTDVQSLRGGVDDAANGYYQALVEARIPFNIADERQLEGDYVDRYRVLVLANIAALSDAQCEQIRAYVRRGGAIVATHETSLYDEWGKRRANFALADLFGCDFAGKVDERVQNSYMTVHGPHPLTIGFDDTPRIMCGTKLVHVTPRPGLPAPALTLVPSYPDLPMERVFSTVRQTDIPMVYATSFGKGRVIYIPTDLDRTFWECSNQDHLALLRNAVLWAAGEAPPMQVSGPGIVDVSFWRQRGSLTAHLVNLTNPMMMRGYMREILPIGPYEVSLALPAGVQVKRVRLLEAGSDGESRMAGNRLVVAVPRVEMHEVVAIDVA